jgi:hypothetical protein
MLSASTLQLPSTAICGSAARTGDKQTLKAAMAIATPARFGIRPGPFATPPGRYPNPAPGRKHDRIRGNFRLFVGGAR